MSAMMTSPCVAFDTNWYLDPGVTNYVTPDPTTKMNYIGTDQIHVGNGLGPNIQLIGSSSFLSLFNSKTLSLKQLWHVP